MVSRRCMAFRFSKWNEWTGVTINTGNKSLCCYSRDLGNLKKKKNTHTFLWKKIYKHQKKKLWSVLTWDFVTATFNCKDMYSNFEDLCTYVCFIVGTWHSRNMTILVVQINPYPTAFPYGNGMVLHFYQQQESSTTKTVHKVINKGLKTYV